MSLTAVILVGGEGTRLRPLTARTPKPMLPLVDRPLLAYTFEHLARHGVDRVVLSCGYLPTSIERHFGSRYGSLEVEYRVEPEPLGTGGGIRFGAEGIEVGGRHRSSSRGAIIVGEALWPCNTNAAEFGASSSSSPVVPT